MQSGNDPYGPFDDSQPYCEQCDSEVRYCVCSDLEQALTLIRGFERAVNPSDVSDYDLSTLEALGKAVQDATCAWLEAAAKQRHMERFPDIDYEEFFDE